ncbi:hypothetical protein [Actinacidiphila guanduensis]|uniref:hypothetical protein n=1 Tax=Actinacidiphila guanduensis TaxID=310781 RepID=UPI00115FEF49|nr:hypothetical protein [Actinacidiphila guanduensis]
MAAIACVAATGCTWQQLPAASPDHRAGPEEVSLRKPIGRWSAAVDDLVSALGLKLSLPPARRRIRRGVGMPGKTASGAGRGCG